MLQLQENGNHGASVTGLVAMERDRESGNARVEFFAQKKKCIREKDAGLNLVEVMFFFTCRFSSKRCRDVLTIDINIKIDC